jgi:hypothetical protein
MDDFYQSAFCPPVNPLQPTDPLFFTSTNSSTSSIYMSTFTSPLNTSTFIPPLPVDNPLVQRTAVVADRKPVSAGVNSSTNTTQSTPRPEEPYQKFEGDASDTSHGVSPQPCIDCLQYM